MNKNPLSDLSFFRFPDLTPEIVRNIILMFLLLVLTVLVTVLVQRWIMSRGRSSRRQAVFNRFSSEHHMSHALREVLSSLLRHTEAKDEFELVHNAQAYETAVHALARTADEATLADLGRLRRMLHLNVMNPDLEFFSTRQLLPDLPLRLTTTLGTERLDIYCALLGLDESAMLIDLPPDEEIFSLLQANPDVHLLYWRERDGETAFPIRLESVEDEEITAFRATHVLRDPGDFLRESFRLSADLPTTYHFLQRTELTSRRGLAARKDRPAPKHPGGEGRLIDVGFGGASLLTPELLPDGGFAQLRFDLNNQPLRLMMEVLSSTDAGNGHYLVRGQFRGIGEEARARLHNILIQEQVKRLRDGALLHIRHPEAPLQP